MRAGAAARRGPGKRRTRDGGERAFLVESPDEESRWLRVRLLDSWNVMGEAAVNLFVTTPGYPGFHMASLDGRVVLQATTWESEASIRRRVRPSAFGTRRR